MRNLLASAIAYAITGTAYFTLAIVAIGLFSIGFLAGLNVVWAIIMAGINMLWEIVEWLL